MSQEGGQVVDRQGYLDPAQAVDGERAFTVRADPLRSPAHRGDLSRCSTDSASSGRHAGAVTGRHLGFGKMFSDGIPTLAPGKVIQTLFDVSVQRFPRRHELPDVYEARIQYTDDTGKRSFDERMNLDLGVYWNLTFVERHGIHDTHARLKEIRDIFKKWTASTGGGLLRVSPDEAAEREERMLRMLDPEASQASNE